jgi:hypothetical protein
MNEAQCHIVFCYISDTVCIVVVNMCFTQDDRQPFNLNDTVSVLLLSGQIVTLLWGECVCNGNIV